MGWSGGNECIEYQIQIRDFSLITQQGKIRGGKTHTANKT